MNRYRRGWRVSAALGLALALIAGCQAPLPPAADYSAQTDAYVAAWNTGEFAALDTLLAPDFVRHTSPTNTSGATVSGIEAMKVAIQDTREAVSGFTIRIEEAVYMENMTVTRWRLTGTYVPTGLPIDVPGASIVRVVDGKMAEEYAYLDMLDLVQQGGMKLVPPEPAEQ